MASTREDTFAPLRILPYVSRVPRLHRRPGAHHAVLVIALVQHGGDGCVVILVPLGDDLVEVMLDAFANRLDSVAWSLVRRDWLKNELIDHAEALQVSSRHAHGGGSLGGLAGSALFGSFITLREKFHSNVLAQAMTLADPLVAARVSQLSAAYGRTITDAAVLKAEGVALLSQQVTREANVLAHNDAFFVIALLAVAAAAALAIHWIYIRIKEATAPVEGQAAIEG